LVWLAAPDTTLNEEQTDFANTIRTSGDHLLNVINDILEYSKLESGKLPIEHIRYSVASVDRGSPGHGGGQGGREAS